MIPIIFAILLLCSLHAIERELREIKYILKEERDSKKKDYNEFNIEN